MGKIYFAPLEGITGYIYRNAFNDIFNSVIDKYFSPFIAPGVNQVLSKKEMRDVLPENNRNIHLIPQLLGCRADDIILAIRQINELGYNEININLGCPSGTVVAKKKGSGLLAYRDELDEFLYGVFEKVAGIGNVKLSVKTRIGKNSPDEFFEILDIYNKYEMEELIIHPRIQKDFYKNTPNMEIFDYAVKNSKNTLCYNGDIVISKDYEKIKEKYPSVDSVMIGRGILRNPMLIDEITKRVSVDREKLIEFHDRLLSDYTKEMSGERPVVFKMKELWAYMGNSFSDADKELKKLRKSESIEKYKIMAYEILKHREVNNNK